MDPIPSHISPVHPTSSPTTPSISPCHHPPLLVSQTKPPRRSNFHQNPDIEGERDYSGCTQLGHRLPRRGRGPRLPHPRPHRRHPRRRPRLRVVAEHHHALGAAVVLAIATCWEIDIASRMSGERGRINDIAITTINTKSGGGDGIRETRREGTEVRTEGALLLPGLTATPCRDLLDLKPDAAITVSRDLRRKYGIHSNTKTWQCCVLTHEDKGEDL
ncbi:hypothetical protein E2562_027102 [Oryza meyeriana var. granulata]|uniref:Uncharacterized protein n=1 Tax=Oryza meyeriana var. granulata TaxID=110450 RepID=A0A6G1EZA7_9ORYZ|nr:hypothetical protein E2562_027102 [Oryza meyeriana var. granulata]